MTDIHKRINRLRTAKNLSMEALAKLVGTTWQTIQQWENGKTAPKRTRLEKVADALGTTPEYLMTGFVHGATVLQLHQQVAAPYIHPNTLIAQVVAIMESTDETGKAMALGAVRAALADYRPAVKNPAS